MFIWQSSRWTESVEGEEGKRVRKSKSNRTIWCKYFNKEHGNCSRPSLITSSPSHSSDRPLNEQRAQHMSPIIDCNLLSDLSANTIESSWHGTGSDHPNNCRLNIHPFRGHVFCIYTPFSWKFRGWLGEGTRIELGSIYCCSSIMNWLFSV